MALTVSRASKEDKELAEAMVQKVWENADSWMPEEEASGGHDGRLSAASIVVIRQGARRNLQPGDDPLYRLCRTVSKNTQPWAACCVDGVSA
jgi:hypothetical protein